MQQQTRCAKQFALNISCIPRRVCKMFVSCCSTCSVCQAAHRAFGSCILLIARSVAKAAGAGVRCGRPAQRLAVKAVCCKGVRSEAAAVQPGVPAAAAAALALARQRHSQQVQRLHPDQRFLETYSKHVTLTKFKLTRIHAEYYDNPSSAL